MCRYELPEGVDTIKQLRRSIVRRCDLTPNTAASLQLFLDGFALLLSSTTSMLRENDLVTVTTKGGVLQPAVETPPVATPPLLPAPTVRGIKKRAATAVLDATAQPAKRKRVVTSLKKATVVPSKPLVAEAVSSSDSSSSDSSSKGTSDSDGDDSSSEGV